MGQKALKARNNARKAKRKVTPSSDTPETNISASAECLGASEELSTQTRSRAKPVSTAQAPRPVRASAQASRILMRKIISGRDSEGEPPPSANESIQTTANEAQPEDDFDNICYAEVMPNYGETADDMYYEEDEDIVEVPTTKPQTAKAPALAPRKPVSQPVSHSSNTLASIEELVDDSDYNVNDMYFDEEAEEIIERPKTKPQTAAPKKPTAQPVRKASNSSKSVASVEGLDDEPEFDFHIEVMSISNNRRVMNTIHSTITFYDLKERFAEATNSYAPGLHLQYRFDTDPKTSLPFELVSQKEFDSLMKILRERIVPPIRQDGQRSTRKMKAITIQIFNKGDGAASGEVKVSKAAKAAAEKQQIKSINDIAAEKKASICAALKEQWHCDIHSAVNKDQACYRNQTTGACHPISLNNLNLWASLHIKDPEQYPLDRKPLEIQLLSTTSRGNRAQNHQESQPAVPSFPYGFYPPVPPWFQNAPPGYPQPPMQLAVQPQAPASESAPTIPKQNTKANIPKITEWLHYCDMHPDRTGDDLSSYAKKFEEEGYRLISQLTSKRISVMELSAWLAIGKGTADLIINYANEDCEHVKNGTFTMDLN